MGSLARWQMYDQTVCQRWQQHGDYDFCYPRHCITGRSASNGVINNEPRHRNGITQFFQKILVLYVQYHDDCIHVWWNQEAHIASFHSTSSYWPFIWCDGMDFHWTHIAITSFHITFLMCYELWLCLIFKVFVMLHFSRVIHACILPKSLLPSLLQNMFDFALPSKFSWALTNWKFWLMVAEQLVCYHSPVTTVYELWSSVEAAWTTAPVPSNHCSTPNPSW